jgi:hypothetical protein
VDFTLDEDDARELRHLAALEPLEARHYLQDRPDLARRMAHWPPELRLEVCRIIYRSFPEDRRERMRHRGTPGSNLLDLLDDSAEA